MSGSTQQGQAFVEYIVVVVFGILVLGAMAGGTRPAACNASGAGDTDSGTLTEWVGCLGDVLQRNYEGYSYAISMSEYPDHDNGTWYTEMLQAQGVDPERIDYLSDDPTDIITELFDEYVSPNVPGLGGLDLGAFLGSLSIGDFLPSIF